MRKSILNSAVMVLIMIAVGCSTKKKVITTTTPAPKADASKLEKINAIKGKNLDFNTLALRARTNLTINNADNDVTLNIRIRKDQAIWVHVSALAGLEVARAYITPDSIKILNRLENVYVNKPFNYVHQFTNPGVNFRMLQSILVGNAASEFVNSEAEFAPVSPFRLSGIIESLTFNLVFSDQNKLLQTNLKDAGAGQTLSVKYSDFAVADGKEFPQSVSIQSQTGNKSVTAELKYTKIDVNTPVEMPFNVPRRFTVLN